MHVCVCGVCVCVCVCVCVLRWCWKMWCLWCSVTHTLSNTQHTDTHTHTYIHTQTHNTHTHSLSLSLEHTPHTHRILCRAGRTTIYSKKLAVVLADGVGLEGGGGRDGQQHLKKDKEIFNFCIQQGTCRVKFQWLNPEWWSDELINVCRYN